MFLKSVVLTLVSGLLLVAVPAHAGDGSCDGLQASLVGTLGDDKDLPYTDGSDVVALLSGDDVYYAGPGNDHVCGDAGHDVILTGAGSDVVFAGAGTGTETRCEST
jgi:Ca2+-binding RTX toxin-like protein